jgi:hypothetical protein
VGSKLDSSELSISPTPTPAPHPPRPEEEAHNSLPRHQASVSHNELTPRGGLYPCGVLHVEDQCRALPGIDYRDSRAQTRPSHPCMLAAGGRLARAIKLRLSSPISRLPGEIFDKKIWRIRALSEVFLQSTSAPDT